jgi:multisubunit Na+/H+ antiporter MnhG subunit
MRFLQSPHNILAASASAYVTGAIEIANFREGSMKLKTLVAILVFTFSASAITGRVLTDAHRSSVYAAQQSVKQKAEAKKAAVEGLLEKGLQRFRNAASGESETRD